MPTLALLLLVSVAFGQASRDAEALFRLGVTYSQQGDHPRARGAFLQALALQPNSVPILNNLGVNALQLGDEPQAERYFRKALSLQPTDADAGFNLGLIELKHRKFAEAARHLKRVAAQRPQDLPVLQGLLEAELGLGSRQAVEESADRLLKLAPADPRFYFQLASPLAAHGHVPAALRVLERARALWPESSDVAYNLAVVHLQAGEVDKARNLAEAAVRRETRADLHHLLGDIYERQNLYDKAVAAYQAAIRLDPKQEDYYFALGYEFLAHHNFELAEQIFSTATLQLPQSLKPRLGLAAAYFARGKYPEVIATLKAATEMSPPSEIAYSFLARTFLLLSDQRELFAGNWVAEKFREYLRLKPDEAFPCYVYAVSLPSDVGPVGAPARKGPQTRSKLRRRPPRSGQDLLRASTLPGGDPRPRKRSPARPSFRGRLLSFVAGLPESRQPTKGPGHVRTVPQAPKATGGAGGDSQKGDRPLSLHTEVRDETGQSLNILHEHSLTQCRGD